VTALRARWWQAVRFMRGRSVRASSWSMVGQAATMLSSTANFLILARLVGPSDYGLIAGTWALVLTTGPVATLGATRLLVRDVSARANPAPVALGAALTTTLVGSAVAVAVLAAVQPLVLPQVPVLLLLGLAAADIVGLGIVSCLTSLYFAAGRARAAGLSAVIVSSVKIAAVVAFAVLGGGDPTTWALIYAALALASAGGQLGWTIRQFGRPSARGYRFMERAREGLPYSGNSAALVAQNDADKTVLVRSGFAEEAGIYSVAYRLASMASLPVLAVLQATFPRFFAEGAEGGVTATRLFARRLIRPLLAFSAVATVGLLVVAPLIPVLVGDEYRGSVVLLMLLAPLCLIRVPQAVWSDALTGAGRQSTRTACVMTSAAVNIAINVAFIPRYGLPAALVATLVAEALYLVLVRVALDRALRAGTQHQPVS
jgi:O-antigen/teichoic acid export membrane protein